MYVPSTEDIRTLYSHNIELYTRIDLLNDRMKTIDSLQGITTEGRISVDADADIRRTYTSTIVLDEKHAISQYSESEWMNKYVWIYIGVKTPMLDDIIWYSQGVYVFSQNGYNYDTQTRSLTINCMDLTAMLNDTLAGQLTGIKTVFKAGCGIRRAMVELLQEVGINKVFVEYWNRTIPYDQEFDAATSVWTILTQLRDLYYPFEIFFDDDVFKCQQIPSCEDDPLVLNADVFNDLIISEDATVDYSEVRNCVEVFGAAASPDVSCTDLVVDTTNKTMTSTLGGVKLSDSTSSTSSTSGGIAATPAAVKAAIAEAKLAAWPIGSIYMSVNSTNPASLFGGTWEALSERFLIGASGSYPAGSTGGSSIHTISKSELPSYTLADAVLANGTNSAKVTTSNSGWGIPNWKYGEITTGGDGNSFSLLPPYLSVWMWKRTK